MDIFESWLINNAITRFGLVTTTEPENSVGDINNSIKFIIDKNEYNTYSFNTRKKKYKKPKNNR